MRFGGQAESFVETPAARLLLVDGFESLRSNSATPHKRLAAAAQRLVELYDAWEKPELAEQYRQVLSDVTGRAPARH